MKESKWLEQLDTWAMFKFILTGSRASSRQRRLLAVGCCRQIYHLLPQGPSREAVAVAEEFADGQASPEKLAEAFRATLAAVQELVHTGHQPDDSRRHAAFDATYVAIWAVSDETKAGGFWSQGTPWYMATKAVRAITSVEQTGGDALARHRVGQANLLWDLFGNPFRPAKIDPAWLDWNGGTIENLAEAAYQERVLPAGTLDNGQLAVLADALEEIGAGNDVLEHLRGPGPHWRGCWCVDLLTGRS